MQPEVALRSAHGKLVTPEGVEPPTLSSED